MKVNFTLVLLLLSIISISQTTRTAISNGLTGWDTPTNWSPTGVPQNGDEVIIPAGQSIRVKNSVYNTKPNLKIIVHGIIAFDNSGKLELGAASTIQLVNSNAKITSDQSASEVIKIADVLKFEGKTDKTLSGPAFSSISTLESPLGFSSGVLAIKLEKFTARYQNKQVNLAWNSTLEQNSDFFTIERSTDTRNWNTIGKVVAMGFAAHYSFNDPKPIAGKSFYRLRMTDIDGKTELSTIVLVEESNALSALAYPNPASKQINISLSSLTARSLNIQLVQNNGRVVFQKNYTGSESYLAIPVADLPRGLYYLVIRSPKEIIERSLIILQ